MPYYEVTINGENFWMMMEDKPSKMGFYTNRYVEATNETEAENKAVQMIRDDSTFDKILNERSDPPMIYCDGISELEGNVDLPPVNQGYVFYREDLDS
ncbi:MAG: hypothetical protein F6K00_33110 [Leptolyngbya sp. SIOISBB]|nr:hypothetical protein [Leptolyngbya sp. SIOISBB]